MLASKLSPSRGGIFTFHVEILLVFGQVFKNWENWNCETWKVERPTVFSSWNKTSQQGTYIVLFINCHFDFCEWPCNLQSQWKWPILKTNYQIKVASVVCIKYLSRPERFVILVFTAKEGSPFPKISSL